jgi:hypothetical protein
MHRMRAHLAAGVVFAWIAAAGCSDDAGPRLESVSPPAATRNAVVALAGHRLCGPSGDCTSAGGEVQLGLEPPVVRANVVSYSDTSAQIVIPPVAHVGATVLIVTVNERSSNALDFEVLP